MLHSLTLLVQFLDCFLQKSTVNPQLYGSLNVLLGFCIHTKQGVGEAPVVKRLGEPGVQTYALVQVVQGIVVPALLQIGPAPIVMGLCVLGV